MKKIAIEPNWPAPKKIKAYTTLRCGGVSPAPYSDLNLADHVGDAPENIKKNRETLVKQLNLPAEPIWLNQIHSTIALPATAKNFNQTADASYTHERNQICVVMTADCLPILLCNSEGTRVAAIHAGWRGLNDGIIKATLDAIAQPHSKWLAWLGPAISAIHYEVGDEVRDAFLKKDPDAKIGFSPSPNQRWLADLSILAKLQLQKLGIHAIYGGEYCTYRDSDSFFSYRRDHGKTGRMASLIYIGSDEG